ncbi:MAG TPA: acetyltransferase [Moraxellaceae bacterium]|nr:acetyltransferase [Moraxellaceae bacterium]
MIAALFPAWFTGVVTLLSLIVIITFWFVLMLPGVLLRCVPVHRLQRLASRYCVWIATNWVASNVLALRLLHRVNWEIDLDGELDPKRSYLLVSNHQSWADILVLFDVFHRRTPFARFFLKRDLMYVPIVGVVCWAMDFPFMTRKAGVQDLATTRRACELYREVPVTVVNFLEGTRFTPAKQAATGSPYRRLLKPKSGGIAYTLNAMGDQFAGVIDVTVEYAPTQRALAWSWLCGEQADVKLHVLVRPVPQHLLDGDYQADPAHRAQVQAWLHELWSEKDARLAGPRRAPAAEPQQA